MNTSKSIVAIGGGENGRPGYPYETLEIDKRIVELSNKENPKLLFIGTASSDSEGYFECIRKNFGNLGCEVLNLAITKNDYTYEELQNAILGVDIIYVGGGNTMKMLDLWRENQIDKLLMQAYNQGIVLSGLSAGSLCWFKYCNSDSLRFEENTDKLILLEGLGFINAVHCPHYDAEENRKDSLKEMMKDIPDLVAIALENCVAIEFIDDEYRIIKSKETSKAYKTYWENNEYVELELEETLDYKPLNELVSKNEVL